MKKYLSICLILSFFLFSNFVLADETYPNIGGETQNFLSSQTSYFNSNIGSNYDQTTRTLTQGRGIPLVEDLDGDGTNEIIILDDDTLTLYQGSNLNTIDSLTLPSQPSGYYFSNLITFDIDGDGYKEIIVAQEYNRNISISQYNGTNFILENQIKITNMYLANADNESGTCEIGCGNYNSTSNSCLIVCTDRNRDSGAGTRSITAGTFNTTHMRQTGTIIHSDPVPADVYCLPQIKTIPYLDYDQDGTEEFIVSYYKTNGQGRISYLSVESDGTVTEEREIVWNDGISTASECGLRDGTPYITAPLVFNFKEGGDLETIVAFSNSANTFKIRAFKSNGDELTSFPVLTDTDGQIISNLFRADAIPDTGNIDVCVMGFDKTEQIIDIFCASAETTLSPNSYEFFWELPEGTFNLSYNGFVPMWSPISHSITVDQTEGVNQILTPYGVFSIADDSITDVITIALCPTIGECDATLLFANPLNEEIAFIPADPENIGQDDLIGLTSTNLWYFDDKITNDNAYIDGSLTFDPCAISQPIKINETLRISFRVSDDERDPINSTVIIYQGEADNESQSRMGVSGTTFSYDFILKNLTGSSIIQIIIHDTLPEHISSPTILNYTFSVTSNGVTSDSGCIDTFYFTAPSDEDDDETTTGEITTSDKTEIIESIFPTEIFPSKYQPILAIFLILLFSGGVLGLLVQANIRDGTTLTYIPVLVGMVTWILTVFLGMISGWTVIVAIIISGALLGFKFYNSRGVGG